MTYTGFRQGDDRALVFETTDGGATFTDISGDLPSAPVNDLLLIEDEVIVGTDVGVFLLADAGSWLAVGHGMPKAPVLDLAYNVPTRTLVAGTFGRSLWQLTLPE
ncbi:MAG: hypothetical protein KY469_07720 [Actinobacteria bacterium]|nr:hypothetical protein [Actinomycetota bacterium]